MIRCAVRPEKLEELERQMKELGIREEDLEEANIRTSGRGGQKRNKTSNGVSLIHRPTGIRIKCCESRSQAMNRFFARRRLVERVAQGLPGTRSPGQEEQDKRRKQKERRRRRAKSRDAGPQDAGSAAPDEKG